MAQSLVRLGYVFHPTYSGAAVYILGRLGLGPIDAIGPVSRRDPSGDHDVTPDSKHRHRRRLGARISDANGSATSRALSLSIQAHRPSSSGLRLGTEVFRHQRGGTPLHHKDR